MTTEFQFGLKHRLYNWNMRSRREERGWRQEDLGALVGYSKISIGLIEGLRYFPIREKAQKLAEVLECPVEILFPEWLKEFKIKSVPKAIEEEKISLEQALQLRILDQKRLTTGGDIDRIEAEVDREILRGRLSEVMETLNPREKKVVDLLFGLHGRPMSLGQVGREFDVTRERIRQIEAKALRKLRHPSRSRKLQSFLWE